MKTLKNIFKRCVLMSVVIILFFFAYSTIEVSAASKKPAKVTLTSVKSYDYNAIKIVWEKVAGAEKYQVYRSTSEDGTYKRIITTQNTSCVNKKLTTGKRYYYKVRAISGDKKGSFSAKKSAKPTLKKVTGINIKAASSTGVKLSWDKVNGAKGYKVYRSTSKDGTYKLIKTTTSKSYTNKGLTIGKKYYYKVRAYRVVNEKNKYGAYSKVVSYKIGNIDIIRQEMLKKVNEERKNQGLPALELYEPINKTAQIKAKDLYETGIFDHYSDNLGYFYDQYDEAGISYYAGGENIAYGQSDVSSVMDSWMNSKGHRANILGDYTHIGIGYYKGYWVQQFIYTIVGITPGEVIKCPNCGEDVHTDQTYLAEDEAGNVYEVYLCEKCNGIILAN